MCRIDCISPGFLPPGRACCARAERARPLRQKSIGFTSAGLPPDDAARRVPRADADVLAPASRCASPDDGPTGGATPPNGADGSGDWDPGDGCPSLVLGRRPLPRLRRPRLRCCSSSATCSSFRSRSARRARRSCRSVTRVQVVDSTYVLHLADMVRAGALTHRLRTRHRGLPAPPQHLPGGGSSRALVASLAPRAVFCVSAERCTHTRHDVSRSAHACPSPSRRGLPQAASPDATAFGSGSAILGTQLHLAADQRVARS